MTHVLKHFYLRSPCGTSFPVPRKDIALVHFPNPQADFDCFGHVWASLVIPKGPLGDFHGIVPRFVLWRRKSLLEARLPDRYGAWKDCLRDIPRKI